MPFGGFKNRLYLKQIGLSWSSMRFSSSLGRVVGVCPNASGVRVVGGAEREFVLTWRYLSLSGFLTVV